MKQYVKRACCAIAFALCGCDSAMPATVSGEGGAGGECAGLREQGQTCLSDCDCAGDLECTPCVSTAERNCVDVCAPNDPYCNNGTATCPIGDGVPCESVKTCQASAPCEPASPCEVAVDQNGACVVETVPGCAVCLAPDGTPGTSRDGGECCGGCWAGSTCRPNPDALACGAGGGLCIPCNGTANCINGACVNQ